MGKVDNKQENYKNEDEISLKEIINVLVNNGKLIAGVTVSLLAIAIIYLFLVAKPVYESSISGYINITNAANEFGEFPFPSERPADYLKALKSYDVLELAIKNGAEVENINTLDKSISVALDKDANARAFTITVQAHSAEIAKKNAEILADAFLKVQERMMERNAVAYHQNMLVGKLNELEQSKVYTEKTIADIEADLKAKETVLTVQKLAVNDPDYAGIMGDKRYISASGKDALLVEIDPLYIETVAHLVEKKDSFYAIERDIEKAKWQLKELESLSAQIEAKEFNEPILRSNGLLFKIITNQIVLNNSSSLSETLVAPRKTFILAVTLFLGLLLGVFTAFFKEYWKNTD